MISVVIPHYKGKEKLFENLKHNLPFLAKCEIIVVNDSPETPLTKEIASLFPGVIIHENKSNLGFSGAVSKGIDIATNPFIFLLNNDVLLRDDSFKKAIPHFEKDNTLFAVSFRQFEKDGLSVGKNIVYWKRGFFQHKAIDTAKSGINGWAEGGSMILDKKKYMKVGGFDTTYSPFYWEDIDLSYRAWKAGYQILFDSSIVVQHHHESTIATHFSTSRIKTIAYRNQFITIWKNISDNKMIAQHLFYLIKNLFIYPFKGESEFNVGFWLAAQLARDIMAKRDIQKKMWKRTDEEIFKQFKKI